MKCRSIVLVRCGFILTAAALSCTAGCKSMSGWKMPSLFASREPDADKLAGRVDTPTSPADKYTPSTLASNSPTGASKTATTTQTTKPSGLPYGNTSTATYGATAPTAPTGGLAAQSNGYQTGPYTTNTGTTSPSKALTGTNNSLTSAPIGTNASQGFVSPYGGTYSGVGSTSTPNVATTSGQMPLNSEANSAALTNSAPGNGIPPYGSTPSLGTGPDLSTGRIPDYPSVQNGLVAGSNSLPTNPAGSAYPPINAPLATATAVATPHSTGISPTVSAYQSALPTGSYSPGTTGRSTNYNFGPPPVTTTPTTAAPTETRSLPPNTASGQQLLVR